MTVYALVASDEPLQVRYVGKTTGWLNDRLLGHRSEPGNPKKRAWIAELRARGATLMIRALSTHESEHDLAVAELKWFLFWGLYCDLVNGEVPKYRHTPIRRGYPRPSEKSDWLRRMSSH